MEGLSDWELQQLRALPNIRKRLRDEIEEVHRIGSMVDALGAHTSLLCQVLSYAWRSTNALTRTCKRFKDIIATREYWQALARRALRHIVPGPILAEMDWFHDLKPEDPPYAYLWSLLKPSGYGAPPPPESHVKKKRLYLSYFRTENPESPERRILRVCWNWSKECASNTFMISTFLASPSLPTKYRFVLVPYTQIVSYYRNHTRMRKVLSVWIGKQWFDQDDIESFAEDCSKINCYVEAWDPVRQQTWCGVPSSFVQTVQTCETDLPRWVPHPENMGRWV